MTDDGKIQYLEKQVETLTQLLKYQERDRLIVAREVLKKLSNGDWAELDESDPLLVEHTLKAICRARKAL